MAVIGYARVSTTSQNLERQVQQLLAFECKPIFKDYYTGHTRRDRTQLNEMLRFLREGDVVVTTSFDRLSRNLGDLLNLIDEIHNRGAKVKSLAQDFDTTTPEGKLAFQVMGMVWEYERDCIRQRTIEGLKVARAQGRIGGRPRILKEAQVELIWNQHQNGKSMRHIASLINVSVGTVHRAIHREKDRRMMAEGKPHTNSSSGAVMTPQRCPKAL